MREPMSNEERLREALAKILKASEPSPAHQSMVRVRAIAKAALASQEQEADEVEAKPAFAKPIMVNTTGSYCGQATSEPSTTEGEREKLIRKEREYE